MGEATERIAGELAAVATAGRALARDLVDEDHDFWDAAARYQRFYTMALAPLRVLAPDRLDEFVACHGGRTPLKLEAFGVADYFNGLRIPGVTPRHQAAMRLMTQVELLGAVSERATSVLHDVRSVLQAEVLDEDLDVARDLLRNRHVRAAGAVAGVVLERHLGSVARARGVAVKKRSPTVADLNDPLRDRGVYDTPQWRFVQRLADIRNLAVHHKEREPTPDEVRELIDGVDKIVKTVV